MAYIQNRAAGVLDMHPSAVLRKASDGAETTSAAEAPVLLDVIDATDYADRQLGSIAVAVMINVTDMDTADGDETYTIALEVASDSVFTTPTKVAELAVPTTGKYYLVVNIPTVEALNSSFKYIRTNLTVAGTTPSITYAANITRVENVAS